MRRGRRTGHMHPRPPTSSPSSHSPIMPKLHLSRRVQHALTGLAILLVSYIIPPYPVGFVLLSLATAAFYHVHWKRVHDEDWDEWYLDRFGTLLRQHEMGEWEDDVKKASDDINGSRDNKQQIHGTTPTCKRRRKTPPALPGAFYFLLGTALSTLLFPTIVARTSLLILSIADPIAGLVGVWFSEHLGWNVTWKQLFQRIKGNKKSAGEGGPSVAGSVACAATTILCTYIYIPTIIDNANSTMQANIISLSLNSRLYIGAITAITEALAGRKLPIIGTALADDNLLIPLVVGSLICWLNGGR